MMIGDQYLQFTIYNDVLGKFIRSGQRFIMQECSQLIAVILDELYGIVSY